ncbi:unnamed protein product [Schistosoma margrebowiei]|uniref:Uncharacterized protein n=1 Tax=Schistosoma margrebowiei TaxID=48269 RepID=A0A183M6I3_9TREM|nr:unnamed protein product [Schistosoma margrebowiei]
METRSKRLKENDEMDSKISKAECGMSDVNDDKCDDNNNNLFSNNRLLHEACQFTGKIKLIQMIQYTL